MQPTRSLQDIIASLNSVYQPQIGLVRQQQADLPRQAQAQTDALTAKKDQAFNDILGGARRRGLGFSGIPLADQAKYTATDYLPALANLQTASNNQATSLEQAILQLQQQQNSQAQNIYQSEQDRAAQLKAANDAAAAQNAAYGGLFSGGSQQPTAAGARIQQRADKGFNFQDSNGRAISAAQYSQLKGIPFRTLLEQMAKEGDQGAKQALGYVGNDYGYNAPKVGTNAQVAKLLNNLLWGVNNVKARTPIVLNGSLGGSTQRLQG